VEYIARADQEKARAAFDRVFTSSTPVELTLSTLNIDGEHVPIHGIWTPVHLRGGTLMAASACAT